MRNSKLKWLGIALLLFTVACIFWHFYSRPKYITASACLKWDATLGSKAGVDFSDLKGCEEVVNFAIRRDTHPILQERGALGRLDVARINLSGIKIFDAAVMWKPDDTMDVDLYFVMSKEQEFDKTYEIYTKLTHPIIVDIPEGDGLLVKSESTQRFARNAKGEIVPGESYIIQQNGDKDVSMRCAMPYYIGPGKIQDVGCTVDYYMPQGFLISYMMRRKHLYRWREVNDLVKKQVEAAIFNQK